MASKSLLKKGFRFTDLFCRNGQAMDRLASHFGLGKQLYSTSVKISADRTVSYLVNSCGLSPDAATLVSHKVKLQTFEKSDSVLALLRRYEFSDTHISTIIRKWPPILVANAEKTLLPKLEFLSSMGMSRLKITDTLIRNPWFMTRSLEKCIVPICGFLKSVVLSDVKLVHILKYIPRIFRGNLSKNVMPNIELVRKSGMPPSCIFVLLTRYPLVMWKHVLFSQLVSEVKQRGFEPRKFSFVTAMNALSGKNTTWKRCHQAYKKWGWSDDDIAAAFRKDPWCMLHSEKKLMATMDFFVNQMGWQSHKVAKFPHVLNYSLEKNIIPRFSVVRVLVLRGLIKDKFKLSSMTTVSEHNFLDKFVKRYINLVPELLDVYRGKLGGI